MYPLNLGQVQLISHFESMNASETP